MSAGTRNSRGFSLVEILVVIAIVAILMSLLMPSMSHARRTAEGISCTANGRGAAIIMLNYLNDSRSYIPPLGPKGSPSWGYNYGSWYGFIRPYLTPNKPQALPANQNFRAEDARQVVCTSKVRGIYTYGYPYFTYAMPWTLRYRTGGDPTTSYRLEELQTHHLTGMFVDNGMYGDSLYYMSIGMFAQNTRIETTGYYYNAQHDGYGVTQVFLDGHAEFAGLTPEMRISYTYPQSAKFAHRSFYGRTGTAYLSGHYRYQP